MEQNLLNKTYDLIDEIKSLKQYKRLLEIKKVIDHDDAIKCIINDFNNAKKKYNDVVQYGKYHPDLKRTQLYLKESKEALYSNDIIKEYKSLEKEIQHVLDDVSRQIATTVSKKIKYPNEIGLINKQ